MNSVDWDLSGSTQEEYENLMAIFNAEEKKSISWITNHLDVYACRIIVPGMSDIYPADDLIYANNNMGMDWRRSY